jgi:Predicted AAA-ATPase
MANSMSISASLKVPGTLFIDKTKYIKLLDHDDTYHCMFLRPRRFGKTTFLNTLCEYYDIAGASSFDDVFGGLYIGKHPTGSRNKHLVLKLDLSEIEVGNGIEIMRTSFNEGINFTLTCFLEKYREWLRNDYDIERIINPNNAATSLKRVLVS